LSLELNFSKCLIDYFLESFLKKSLKCQKFDLDEVVSLVSVLCFYPRAEDGELMDTMSACSIIPVESVFIKGERL
jgi:hypothetical protein